MEPIRLLRLNGLGAPTVVGACLRCPAARRAVYDSSGALLAPIRKWRERFDTATSSVAGAARASRRRRRFGRKPRGAPCCTHRGGVGGMRQVSLTRRCRWPGRDMDRRPFCWLGSVLRRSSFPNSAQSFFARTGQFSLSVVPFRSYTKVQGPRYTIDRQRHRYFSRRTAQHASIFLQGNAKSWALTASYIHRIVVSRSPTPHTLHTLD
ncbi:hypothetical protein BDY21DRAFT_80884 [Lineolata rhizophorae]|uniref:Uncharacterized protein n=1 Tax=Lineolata rhizophorae TaxID=578093 RepID=A0A6A6NTX1_9PEZI|nr:hypothetical protein BDY21DRAFT_80884 [Lineolata rhizophorae]